MSKHDDYCLEASQYWDLERLYNDLAVTNGGKSITPSQKKFLRGTLQYKKPKEMAEVCQCGVDWVKQCLSQIYRLIETMLGIEEHRCNRFDKVCLLLDDYKIPDKDRVNQLLKYSQIPQELDKIIDVSLEKPIWKSLDDVMPYINSFTSHCEQGKFLEAFYIIFDGDDYRNCVYTFLSNLGYFEEIVRLYEKLIPLWQPRINEKWEFGIAITCLADAYDRLEEYQIAIDYHKMALEISQEINDLNSKAGSLINLGCSYYSLEKYADAMKYNRSGLDLARAIGNKEFQGNALNNFGLIFQAKKKYDLAIDYHYHALDIRRELEDQHGQAGSLINIGDNYRYLSQDQMAVKFLVQGIEIAHRCGYKEFAANGWFNLGLALENLGDESKATVAKEKALSLFQEMGLEL